MTQNKPGWTVKHWKYGTWFISREAVAADWLQDHQQAYPDDLDAVATDDVIDTWFSEQISWIEISRLGQQIDRPDMVAIEAMWLKQMKNDSDYVSLSE